VDELRKPRDIAVLCQEKEALNRETVARRSGVRPRSFPGWKGERESVCT